MRKIELSVSRSVKVDLLKKQYRDKIPADWKDKEYPFGVVGTREFPESFSEAVKVWGEAAFYEKALKQACTDANNQIGTEILDKVLDAVKAKRRTGKVILVDI